MQWDSFFRDAIAPMQAYQPGMREEQIREIAQVNEIYKLSSNESPLPPFSSALEAMTKALPLLNEYPDGSSHILKTALAEHYDIPYANILAGNGTNELLTLIAETCLDQHTNVIYCWPSFIVYRYSAQMMGAHYKELPLASGGGFDLEAILAKIDDDTRIVYICTPNNPTGVCVQQDVLEDFLARVPQHVLVVIDAAYDEFVVPASGSSTTPLLSALPSFSKSQILQKPVVVLKTFSKIYGLAGIRAGYGFAPEPLVKAIDRVREPFNVNSLAQLAAAASLKDAKELAKRRELNARCRHQLESALSELNLKYYSSQANFVWLEVPDAARCFDLLLSKGIIVRPFAQAAALRIGIGEEKATQATIQALREIFA